MLPDAVAAALAGALGAPAGASRPLPGGGGGTGLARVEVGRRALLVKWAERPDGLPPGAPGPCEAEARGLALLAASGAVRVPSVAARGTAAAVPSRAAVEWLAMEWIDEAPAADRGAAGAELGRRLAELHRAEGPAYGLDHDNYCGATPQPNRWGDSWVRFYGERRLGFQMEWAAGRGRMPAARRRRLERLIAGLSGWVDEAAVRPSLVHGDLWGGNWLVAPGPGAAGEPVLIDPAAHYADREVELAMCRLFGGFPERFYQAYDAAWPPAPGRQERVPLYQLYHLLNHLSLFGESYGRRVDAVLDHYVG